MGDTKRNDPQSLRDGGKVLGETGDETSAAWQKLQGESDGMGDIFGDDDVGGLIGMIYGAVSQLGGESIMSGADDYKKFGDGLKLSGDNHEKTEKTNTEMLEQLDKRVQDSGGA